jgi:hypothetical protein
MSFDFEGLLDLTADELCLYSSSTTILLFSGNVGCLIDIDYDDDDEQDD